MSFLITIGQKHGGLGKKSNPAHEALSGHKKAGRFPIRDDEGPAKNLLLGRQKNAQQDTKTQSSYAGISVPKSKRANIKLGRFSSSFAETWLK